MLDNSRVNFLLQFKDVFLMETLIAAVTTLCMVATVLLVFLALKVAFGAFDTKHNQSVVNLDNVKAGDNIYTEIAAREHTKAAIANREAAEFNLKTEELRSARLKQGASE